MGLAEGSRLERYEIVKLVGRGGMGEVYHAIDTRLRRPVALKVLRADKDQSYETGNAGVARLMREAQAAAALNHPNSVAIYELGEAGGVHFIAMELITGSSFRRHSQSKDVAIETKVGWLVDAARALHAAHRVGIIHRDIKPANIMVSDEGAVKVLDFGLAKPADVASSGPPASFQTSIGQVLGTPRYMAPEQVEGHPPDARSDQFAFGLTAYELLTGEYAGGPLVTNFTPLDVIAPAVPPVVSGIVLRMLSFDKAARFASMEEVAGALKAALPAVRAHAQSSTAPLLEDRTEKQARAPVDPSLMALRPADRPPIGTIKMQTPPQGVPPAGGPPRPVDAKGATLALAPPITPLALPPPAPSQPSARSSAPRLPGVGSSPAFPLPASSPPKSSQTVWIVVAVAVALFALLTGGLLAVFLR